jgi:hypothetical protein
MYLDKINKKTTIRLESIISSTTGRNTQIIIVAIILSLILWDIYLYIDDQKENISIVIRENAKGKLFVITWIWGILSAHLFVSKKETIRSIPEHIAIIILSLTSIIIFLLGRYIPNEIPQYMQLVFLFFGAIAGYYLWPQTISKAENDDY